MWTDTDEGRLQNQRGLDRLYHAKQAEMVERFRNSEKQMAALRLHCQLVTQRRREQFVGVSLVDGSQTPVVITHHGYPAGMAMIQYGLCGIGAEVSGACFFCAFGHLTECHFPFLCKAANCSHAQISSIAEALSQPTGMIQ